MMADSSARRLDNLDIEQILMSRIAPVERSLVHKLAETIVLVLEKPYATSYHLSTKLKSKAGSFLIDQKTCYPRNCSIRFQSG